MADRKYEGEHRESNVGSDGELYVRSHVEIKEGDYVAWTRNKKGKNYFRVSPKDFNVGRPWKFPSFNSKKPSGKLIDKLWHNTTDENYEKIKKVGFHPQPKAGSSTKEDKASSFIWWHMTNLEKEIKTHSVREGDKTLQISVSYNEALAWYAEARKIDIDKVKIRWYGTCLYTQEVMFTYMFCAEGDQVLTIEGCHAGAEPEPHRGYFHRGDGVGSLMPKDLTASAGLELPVFNGIPKNGLDPGFSLAMYFPNNVAFEAERAMTAALAAMRVELARVPKPQASLMGACDISASVPKTAAYMNNVWEGTKLAREALNHGGAAAFRMNCYDASAIFQGEEEKKKAKAKAKAKAKGKGKGKGKEEEEQQQQQQQQQQQKKKKKKKKKKEKEEDNEIEGKGKDKIDGDSGDDGESGASDSNSDESESS